MCICILSVETIFNWTGEWNFVLVDYYCYYYCFYTGLMMIHS